MPPRYWREIRVEIPESLAEPVTAALLEKFPRGLHEQHSGRRVTLVAFEESEETVDSLADKPCPVDAPPGEPRRGAWPDNQPQLESDLRGFMASRVEVSGLPAGDLRVHVSVRPEADYVALARSHFKSLEVGGLLIYPSWDPPPAENHHPPAENHHPPAENHQPPAEKHPMAQKAPMSIRLDPGLAFGTGHHATTQGCLDLMAGMPLRSRRVLDVGTGTGILALAAGRWGAGRCLGVDRDPLAVEVARGNVTDNGLCEVVEVSVGGVESAATWPADLVVANLDSEGVTELLQKLAGLEDRPRDVVLSGVTSGQWAAVEPTVTESGYGVVRKLDSDGWVSVWVSENG